jgi:hypothetical protein
MTSSSAAMQHNNNLIIGSSYAREVALPSYILIAALAIDTLAAWFIDIIEGPLVTAPGFAMFVAVQRCNVCGKPVLSAWSSQEGDQRDKEQSPVSQGDVQGCSNSPAGHGRHYRDCNS